MPRKTARQESSPPKRGTTKRNEVWQLLFYLLVGLLMGMVLMWSLLSEPSCPTQTSQTPVESLRQFQNKVLETMKDGGCVGINKFLTFTNFTSDLQRMQQEYLEKYSAGLDNPFGNDTVFYPPAALTLGLPDLDCKQQVLWVNCLSNYYPNVNCTMYYSAIVDGTQHVGMECSEGIGNVTYYTRT